MTIDTVFKTSKQKITYPILLALFITPVIYALVEGFKANIIIFGLAFIFLFAYLFMLYLKLYYFYYDDEKNKIIIRYYHSHPYIRKYKSIEIFKNNLVDYDITTSFFGLRKNLTITVASKNGNIEYPTISISTLNNLEIKKLTAALDANIL